jgi:hypothetical protein
VSPDNTILAIMRDGLNILCTSDYAVIYSDTTWVKHGIFSHDSRTFYATFDNPREHPFVPYQVDLFDSVQSPFPSQFQTNVHWVIPTPDGAKLLLYLTFYFSAYDIDRDTVVFNKGFWPAKGNLGMTLDGKYAFFSNPSTPFYEPGTTDLYVFDIEANQIADTIVIDDFLDSIGARATYGVGRMAFTPDGRWMIAHNAQEPFELYLFDLQKMALVDFHRFSNNWFSNISVQQMK